MIRLFVILKLFFSKQVDKRLDDLKNVTNFTEFVNAFSQFGGDMVDLAYISGERQNVSKNQSSRNMEFSEKQFDVCYNINKVFNPVTVRNINPY